MIEEKEKDLMVVIQMVTYNHEKYITEAIKSVMNQKTSFKYRLIICEDCSTDGTAEICKKYKANYPDKIQLILNERNLGVIENARQAHAACFGSGSKYIAILEGDDYWTDTNKLQKQINFLEANPDYAICCHGVSYKNMGNNKIALLKTNPEEKTYTINDLAAGNVIYTPSVVFRNGLVNKLPDWFWQASAGDYVLHMLNAKKGKVKYFPQTMAVYRIHNNGYWISLGAMERAKKWVIGLNFLMTEDFPPEVICGLKKQAVETMQAALLTLLRAEEYEIFEKELQNYLSHHPEERDNWIYKVYPEFFKSTSQSRSYKLAKKISSYSQKMKRITRK